MKTISIVRPIGSENFEQVSIKNLEFSMKKSSKQKADVNGYQMDPDTAQQRISDSINQFIKFKNIHLEFEVDIDQGSILIKVIDDTTKDVIREFCLSTILYADKNMKSMNGIFINRKI